MTNTDYFCNVPDNLGDVGVKWPFTKVTIFSSGSVNGVNLADASEIACQRWNAVCGIELSMTNNPRTAHIVHTVGRIDGPGNVLAQHQLPVGFIGANNWRQLSGIFDLERVVLADNPPQGFMDLGRICTHELGHGLGIGHITDGNLMAPRYSDQIKGPQNGDILEVLARYPRTSPPTPSGPSEGIIIESGGNKYEWVGWRKL